MKKTYVMAATLIGLLILWMLSGIIFPSEKHEEVTIESATGNKDVVRVRTRIIEAELQGIELAVMGKTEAKRVVDIKAEIGGKIIATPVEKGQRVKKGEVLCELAEEDRLVQLNRAQASLEQAQVDYEGTLRLGKQNLVSSAQVAASKTLLETARAALKMAQLNVEYLKMYAPFAAYVEDRPAQVGALIDRNGICAKLLDESSLLATGQVSERDVQLLNLGQAVQVLFGRGDVLQGEISFLGRTADPLTRTYTIEAELDVGRQIVRDGMTAKIMIPLNEVLAHHISPAVLALDDNGNVGVRIVNANSEVEFHLVDIVKESVDGIWITGLPNKAQLITVGQELVANGDKVQAVIDNLPFGKLPSVTGQQKASTVSEEAK